MSLVKKCDDCGRAEVDENKMRFEIRDNNKDQFVASYHFCGIACVARYFSNYYAQEGH